MLLWRVFDCERNYDHGFLLKRQNNVLGDNRTEKSGSSSSSNLFQQQEKVHIFGKYTCLHLSRDRWEDWQHTDMEVH